MTDVKTLPRIGDLRHSSWTWLLRNVFLPAWDAVSGQEMMARLKRLEEAQWWDRDTLHKARDEALKSLIRTAYREVPFYQRLIVRADVEPAEILKPADLQRLPVVTKDMLRRGFPDLTTRETGFKTHTAHTSGSTGKNFRVIEDSYTRGWWRASFVLALEWAGWSMGEPHLQTGMSVERGLVKTFKDLLLRCHYVSAYDLSDAHLDAMLAVLHEHKIKHVWGYPGSLYYLAKRAREVGWNQPLDSAVTWGDNLFPHYRSAIASAFQTEVYDTYGCAEGIQVAAQCEYKNYHVHTLDVVVEYVDDEGYPVPSDETGRLLLTRLHPGAMPLIRYAVGDIGVAGDDQQCECGRTFDLMACIQGRDTDVITTPSGNRLIVHFFTGILEYFPEIDSFQVVQDDPSEILLRLVPSSGYTSAVGARVVRTLKDRGAGDLEIHVDLVDGIPLPPTGKRRFVINNLAGDSPS